MDDYILLTDSSADLPAELVEELDVEKNRVRVTVSMFGRETPVELELDQAEPVD